MRPRSHRPARWTDILSRSQRRLFPLKERPCWALMPMAQTQGAQRTQRLYLGGGLQTDMAHIAGSPAGLAAHALPATTHTSAPPLAQAHAAPVQLRAPVEASTMEPGVPSGDAPRSRPGHWAEHPGGVPGQGGQHAHQIVGQEPIQEAPSDAQHEAAHRPSAREGK